MKTYNALSILALVILALALPFYALREADRATGARAALQERIIGDAVGVYAENCAVCHGLSGEGRGVMPPLNSASVAGASRRLLYRTIAHTPHGSVMAAWHLEEGGILTTYEVEGLVALIQNAAWERAAAAADGIALPELEAFAVDLTAMEGDSHDPHECRACHEEPAVHAARFGLNCARCHSLQAWKPALLTRHDFPLDHGGGGRIACQTCHTYTYSDHTCYGCHDHTPELMEAVHSQVDLEDGVRCVSCHPTGQPGEADTWRAGPVSDQPAHLVEDRH